VKIAERSAVLFMCTMCRCCCWVSWWEIDHYLRCHILSLLLQDEGWVSAGT